MKKLFEPKHNLSIALRSYDLKTNIMNYQGTPDLETLSSYVFHYGYKNQDLFVCFDESNKPLYTNDIVIVRLDNQSDFSHVAMIVYDEVYFGFSLQHVDNNLPNLPIGKFGVLPENIKLLRSTYQLQNEDERFVDRERI